MGLFLAIAGLVVIQATMLQYLATIRREKVPIGVGLHSALAVLGLALSAAGVVFGGGGWAWGLGAVSAMVGTLILYLFSIRRLPDGRLIAKVGQPIPALSALDADGQEFDLASLRGQRVMLKFFRGSW